MVLALPGKPARAELRHPATAWLDRTAQGSGYGRRRQGNSIKEYFKLHEAGKCEIRVTTRLDRWGRPKLKMSAYVGLGSRAAVTRNLKMGCCLG